MGLRVSTWVTKVLKGWHPTIGEVEPVHKVRILLLVRLDEKFAIAIHLGDVLDTGSGLGNHLAIVLDDRCRSGRMESLIVGWCEYWVTLVVLELVVDAEFLAEPDDSFRLGDLEVVDCESHVAFVDEPWEMCRWLKFRWPR